MATTWLLIFAALLSACFVHSYPSCDTRMFEKNYFFLLNDHGISYYAFADFKDQTTMNKAIDDHLLKLCYEQPVPTHHYEGLKLFYSTNYTHLIVTLVVRETRDFRIGIVEVDKLLNLSTNFINYDTFLLDHYRIGAEEEGNLEELERDRFGMVFYNAPREKFICDAEKASFNRTSNTISFPRDVSIVVDLENRTARIDLDSFDGFRAYECSNHNEANERTANFFEDQQDQILDIPEKGMYLNQAVGNNSLKAEKHRDPDSPYAFVHYYHYQAANKTAMCQLLEVNHNVVPRALIIPVALEDRHKGELINEKHADPYGGLTGGSIAAVVMLILVVLCILW